MSKGLVKIARSKSRCVSRCVAKAARGAIDVADCDGPSVADPTTHECIARGALDVQTPQLFCGFPSPAFLD